MIWNQSVRSRIPIVGLVLGFKRSWQNLAEGVCSHSGGVHPNPLGFAKFGNFTNFSKYSPNILPNSGECWNIFWFFPIISRNTSISQSLLCMSLAVYHKTPWAAEELQLFSPCCSARGKSWSWKWHYSPSTAPNKPGHGKLMEIDGNCPYWLYPFLFRCLKMSFHVISIPISEFPEGNQWQDRKPTGPFSASAANAKGDHTGSRCLHWIWLDHGIRIT